MNNKEQNCNDVIDQYKDEIMNFKNFFEREISLLKEEIISLKNEIKSFKKDIEEINREFKILNVKYDLLAEGMHRIKYSSHQEYDWGKPSLSHTGINSTQWIFRKGPYYG